MRYRCGEFLLDPANRRFTGPAGVLSLEPRVFAVIVELVAHADHLLTRDALLDAVWGHRYATPSTLNRVITLARRAFGDDGSAPRFIQTVYGAGYRYIGPVEVEDDGSGATPARFGPPEVCVPPVRTQALIGREPDLAKLQALLDAHRAVSVVGPGGMGKTQCVLELAQRANEHFPDGVWFFDLVAVERGDDWLGALATALAISRSDPAGLMGQIAAQMRDRQMLLVLDNCDRVAVDIGALLIELLRLTRAPRCLATTQAPLRFAGEQLYRLGPLSLVGRDEAGASPLQVTASAPAVDLFLTRARLVLPDFALTEANADAIVEICRRLDGMPLALEFAAARVSLLSPSQILERLDQRFQFLGSAAAGVDVRHRNLQALLEWSCSLLTVEEQRLLNWCGVFVQGWTVEALLPVGAALGHSGAATVELLSSLVNHSLVSVDLSSTPPRYKLLETVREYALARLEATQEKAAACAAHLQAIDQLCRIAHADVLGGRMMARSRQSIHEYGNIRAAVDWACQSLDSVRLGQSIVGSLLFYIRAHDAFGTAFELAQRVLSPEQVDPGPERGRCLLTLGVTQLGRLNAIGDVLSEASRIAAAHGDLWTFAFAQGYLAMWHSEQGLPDNAADPLATCERIATKLADPMLLGVVGFAHGWRYLAMNDYANAARVLEAARDLGTDLVHQQFVGIYVGLTHYLMGDYARAAEDFQRSLQRSLVLGSLRFAAGNLEGTAYLCIEHGLSVEAARLLAAAEAIRARTVPLLGFWIALHENAERRVRAALGSDVYERTCLAAADRRDEDSINEALLLLRRFSTRTGSDSARAYL